MEAQADLSPRPGHEWDQVIIIINTSLSVDGIADPRRITTLYTSNHINSSACGHLRTGSAGRSTTTTQ